VHENTRVRDAVAFLQKDDFSEFGQLMFESHVSSRDLYEVSHPRLDLLVEIAREQDGVIGSRMTGAGFGGAVICLIKAKLADGITNNISSEYERETGKIPNTIVCEIPDGVKTREINLDRIRL
jgi:galactokinase